MDDSVILSRFYVLCYDGGYKLRQEHGVEIPYALEVAGPCSVINFAHPCLATVEKTVKHCTRA